VVDQSPWNNCFKSSESLFPICYIVQETEIADSALNFYMVCYLCGLGPWNMLKIRTEMMSLKLMISWCKDFQATSEEFTVDCIDMTFCSILYKLKFLTC